jgi:hypothetical protein
MHLGGALDQQLHRLTGYAEGGEGEPPLEAVLQSLAQAATWGVHGRSMIRLVSRQTAHSFPEPVYHPDVPDMGGPAQVDRLSDGRHLSRAHALEVVGVHLDAHHSLPVPVDDQRGGHASK